MPERDEQPTNLRKVAHAHVVKIIEKHDITITDLLSSLVMYMFYTDAPTRQHIIEQGGKVLGFAQMGAEFELDMNANEFNLEIQRLLKDAPKS